MVAPRSPSLYELLEVSSGATFEEIEQSYRRIAAYLGAQALAVYSILDSDEAQQLRMQIDEAYRTLSDPERRAAYDRMRHEEYPPITVPALASTATSTADAPEMSDTAKPVQDKHLPVRGRAQSRHALRGPQVRTGRAPLYGRDVTIQARDPRGATDVQPRAHKPRYGRLIPAAPQRAVTQTPPASRPIADGSQQLVEGRTDKQPWASTQAESALEASPPPMPAPAALSATARSKRRVLTPTITVTADTEFGGGVLRNLRESAGASLDELAEITKVGKRYLIAIESNDFAALPAAVYTRGFVTELARAMGLDPAPVTKSFMALYAKHRGAGG